jgi:oxygen-independent coproporphyrinogen-3 oxidase
VILSLLGDGLDLAGYRERFGADAMAELPELRDLVELDVAAESAGLLRLNAAGIERSDTIGPWLHSRRVDELIGSYRPA